MRHRRVGHGKQLHHLLPRLCGPLDEQVEVGEVADAEALLRTQGEDGHGHSRSLPAGQGEDGESAVEQGALACLDLRVGEAAVGAFFPGDDAAVAGIVDDKLVLGGILQPRGVELDAPLGRVGIVHQQDAVGVPFAQGGLAAQQAEAESLFHPRGEGAEHEALAVRAHDGEGGHVLRRPGGEEPGEVEALAGHVAPGVEAGVCAFGRVAQAQDARIVAPFAADDGAAFGKSAGAFPEKRCVFFRKGLRFSENQVAVFYVGLAGRAEVQLQGPAFAVGRVQGDSPFFRSPAQLGDGAAYADFIAPAGQVLDGESELHGVSGSFLGVIRIGRRRSWCR